MVKHMEDEQLVMKGIHTYMMAPRSEHGRGRMLLYKLKSSYGHKYV
jgi:hypothetical protein